MPRTYLPKEVYDEFAGRNALEPVRTGFRQTLDSLLAERQAKPAAPPEPEPVAQPQPEPVQQQPVPQPMEQPQPQPQGTGLFDDVRRRFSAELAGIGTRAPEPETAQVSTPTYAQQTVQPRQAATPTTVDLGAGKREGSAGDQGGLLGAIGDIARRALGSDEAARVAQAIAVTEGGMGGAVGDVEGGGSYGPFQFYWQGQLGSFANDLGMSLQQAGEYARTHPLEAAEWALRPGGYLGSAIQRGIQQGLSGADLATYAQRTGQVSVSPERAGQNYANLFGGGGGGIGIAGRPLNAPAAPSRERAPTDTEDGDIFSGARRMFTEGLENLQSAAGEVGGKLDEGLGALSPTATGAAQRARAIGDVAEKGVGLLDDVRKRFADEAEQLEAVSPGRMLEGAAGLAERVAPGAEQIKDAAGTALGAILEPQAASYEATAQEAAKTFSALPPEQAGVLGTFAAGAALGPGGAPGKVGKFASRIDQALDADLILPGAKAALGQIVGPKGELLSTVAESGGVSGIARTVAGAEQLGQVSKETLARLPNLSKLKDVGEDVLASMVRIAEENPGIIDTMRRGKITHRQLIENLAPRAGMTAEDFLKTPVGKAFNETELLVLRAAMVQKEVEAGQLAERVFQKGVGSLNDVELGEAIAQIADAGRLQAVMTGAKTTAGRTLNSLKIPLSRVLSQSITASNERVAAERALKAAQAKIAREQARIAELGAEALAKRAQPGVKLGGKAEPPVRATGEKLASGPAKQSFGRFDTALKESDRVARARAQKALREALEEARVAQKRIDNAAKIEERSEALKQERVRKLLDAIGGRKVTEKTLEEFSKIVQTGDPLATANFLRGLQSTSNWERLNIIRYGSMLSSTSTHMVNSFSNAVKLGLDIGLKPVAVGIDVARAKVTRTPRAMYLAEMGPEIRGTLEGGIAGFRDVLVVLRTGVSPADVGKLELRQPSFGVNAPIDFLAELSGRALVGADLVFRGAAQGGHTRALATRRAIQEGSKGRQIAKRAQEIVENIVDFPDLLDEAEKLAAQSVFQETREITTAATRLREKIPGGSIIVPFVRTLVNIAAQGVEMTPVGFATAIRAARRGEQSEAAMKAARGLFGSGVMLVSFNLAEQGYLTAGYPDDQTVQSTLPPNWKEWSLLVPRGDGSVVAISYAQLGPLAWPMAAGVIASQMHRAGEPVDSALLGRVVGMAGSFVLDQTFARGISDMINAIDDPDRRGENFIEGLATQFEPYGAFQRQLTTALGIASRDKRGAIEALLASNPFTAEQVPERLSRMGEPIQPGMTGIGAFISPQRYDIIQPDPILRTYRDAGINLPKPPKNVVVSHVKVDLTREEQAEFAKRFGEFIRQNYTEYLDKIPRQIDFERMTAKEREEVNEDLLDLRDDALEEAREAFRSIVSDERLDEAEREEDAKAGQQRPTVPVGPKR